MEMMGDITSDAFSAFCRERGLKCTAQRLAVFNVVRRHELRVTGVCGKCSMRK